MSGASGASFLTSEYGGKIYSPDYGVAIYLPQNAQRSDFRATHATCATPITTAEKGKLS